MANYTNIETLQDGPRNVVLKLTGILDTADITATELVDPADLSIINKVVGVANRLAIEEIKFNIEDALAVYLYWTATSDVLIVPLQGRGKIEFDTPLTNTEAAGVTGAIKYATQGFSGTLSFTLILHLRKYTK